MMHFAFIWLWFEYMRLQTFVCLNLEKSEDQDSPYGQNGCITEPKGKHKQAN